MDETKSRGLEDSTTPRSHEDDSGTPSITASKRRGRRQTQNFKRSSRACVECRARKVRCDIVLRGAPCSNCAFDDVDCAIAQSKRQRIGLRSSIFSRQPETETSSLSCSLSKHLTPHDQEIETQVSKIGSGFEASGMINNDIFNVWSEAYKEYSSLGHAPDSWKAAQTVSPEPLSPSSCNTMTYSREKQSQQAYQHPLGIFHTFPQHIKDDDVMYLEMKDALSLPTPEMRTELMQAYGRYVHCQMPIIEIRDAQATLQASIEPRGPIGPKKMSLLLFQAIMLAAMPFVKLRILHDAGYATREAAHDVLYGRVKLLYNIDCEKDRLCIAQSLLLMAHSEQEFSNHHDRWHWLGLAISLSYSLGLHRSVSIPMRANTIQYGVRRRIWWTCFIYDRLYAFLDRKPTRIWREDCSVPMVQVSDFPLGDMSVTGDLMYETQVAQSFVEKAILCWCTNDEMIQPLTNAFSHTSSNEKAIDDEGSVSEVFLYARELQCCDADETRTGETTTDSATETELPSVPFEFSATSLEQASSKVDTCDYQWIDPNECSYEDLSAQPTFLLGEDSCNTFVSSIDLF